MAWDKDLPAGGALASLLDNKVRDNNAQLETALDNQHVFTTAGAQLCTHRPGVCNVLFHGTTVEIAAALIDATHPIVHDSIIYDTDLKKFFTSDGAGSLVAIELSGSGIANAISTDAALGSSDVLVPSQKAVKAVIETQAFTMAGKTLTSPKIDTGVSGTAIDATATLGTSDTLLPTQKAVKTYVDTQVAAVPANWTGRAVGDAAVYNGTPASGNKDLDLSAIVGAKRTLCMFLVTVGNTDFKMWPSDWTEPDLYGVSGVDWGGSATAYFMCATGATGHCTWNSTAVAVTIKLVGFIP